MEKWQEFGNKDGFRNLLLGWAARSEFYVGILLIALTVAGVVFLWSSPGP
jgi:hypothetical protein